MGASTATKLAVIVELKRQCVDARAAQPFRTFISGNVPTLSQIRLYHYRLLHVAGQFQLSAYTALPPYPHCHVPCLEHLCLRGYVGRMSAVLNCLIRRLLPLGVVSNLQYAAYSIFFGIVILEQKKDHANNHNPHHQPKRTPSCN